MLSARSLASLIARGVLSGRDIGRQESGGGDGDEVAPTSLRRSARRRGVIGEQPGQWRARQEAGVRIGRSSGARRGAGGVMRANR